MGKKNKELKKNNRQEPKTYWIAPVGDSWDGSTVDDRTRVFHTYDAAIAYAKTASTMYPQDCVERLPCYDY